MGELRDHMRLGVLACHEGRHADGVEYLTHCLAQQPEDLELLKVAVSCFAMIGRLQEATRFCRRWVELAPDTAEAHLALARLHFEQLEISQTLVACARAVECDPHLAEAHFQRASALLISGRMTEGWESYEWRSRVRQALDVLPIFDRPPWDGRPLPPGKLLLIMDQGFGDCLQFMRFVPWVVNRAPDPIVYASKELEPIVRQCKGLNRIRTDTDAVNLAEMVIPVSGLPRLVGIGLDCIPGAEGYLAPDPVRAERWRRKLDRLLPRDRRRIAIAWAGRPTHPNDRRRSVRLNEFMGPLADADVVLLSVQKGPAIAEIGTYFGAAPLINLGPEIADFADTLAILKNVERLVTVDTAVAHLAGAAGVPTSIALPYVPDWRWLLDRDDSPWYRSVKLYRQRRYGEWPDVMQRIAADLATAAGSRPA